MTTSFAPPKSDDFREILAWRNIAPHLDVVLCRTGGPHGWVTWKFNRSDRGFHFGHYFKTREEAEADFADRR